MWLGEIFSKGLLEELGKRDLGLWPRGQNGVLCPLGTEDDADGWGIDGIHRD